MPVPAFRHSENPPLRSPPSSVSSSGCASFANTHNRLWVPPSSVFCLWVHHRIPATPPPPRQNICANKARVFRALWSATIHCRFAIPGIHSLLFSPPESFLFAPSWLRGSYSFTIFNLPPRSKITSIIPASPQPSPATPPHTTQQSIRNWRPVAKSPSFVHNNNITDKRVNDGVFVQDHGRPVGQAEPRLKEIKRRVNKNDKIRGKANMCQ